MNSIIGCNVSILALNIIDIEYKNKDEIDFFDVNQTENYNFKSRRNAIHDMTIEESTYFNDNRLNDLSIRNLKYNIIDVIRFAEKYKLTNV